MAERKRAVDIFISGRMDGKLQRACGRASKAVAGVQRAIGGLNREQRASRASSGIMGGGLLKSAIGFAAAYVGTQQLIQGVKGTIQAYQEQAAANMRSQTLMMNVKGTTLAQVKALNAYAGALQSVTTVGDEVTQRGQSQLATFQLNAGAIRKLTPALQDLAVGTYGVNVNQDQMQQSANLIGKVFTGQVGALRRVGIAFDKHQEKMLKNGTQAQKVAMLTKVISQNYGGLAKRMAQTPEGRVIQLANAWGDVKEEIGAKLMPVITKLLQWIGPRLPAIQTGILKIVNASGKWISKLRPIWDVAYKIGTWVRDNWSVVGPIIMGIVGALAVWKATTMALTAVQLALNVALTANPIGLIIVAIGVLIGLIVLLVRNWGKVVNWLKIAWNWFVKFGTEGVGRFIPIVNIIALIAKNWDKVVAAAKLVWSWIVKIAKIAWKLSPLGMIVNATKGIASKIAGKRAAGGPVAAGRSYLVGERGPELFTPSLSGRISPNMALAGAGGINVTWAPVVNVAPGADRNEVAAGLNTGYEQFKANLKRFEQDRRRRTF